MNGRVIAMCATLWVAGSAGFAQNLLENGTFDVDLGGWTLQEPMPPDSTIAWDPAGNPGGSLRIASTWDPPLPRSIVAVSECLTPDDLTYVPPFEPNGGGYLLHLVGESYAELLGNGDDCRFNIAMYDLPDCSDSPALSANGSSEQGVWESREDYAAITENVIAFRIRLALEKYPGGAANSCRYDNLAFFGPDPPPLVIPTLDRLGLGLLVGLVGVAGMAISYRRRARCKP